MKRSRRFVLPALLIAATAILYAQNTNQSGTVVVTASNTGANQLLVYSQSGVLLQTVPTSGQGGVTGNAGGIAAHAGLVGVVNFGSKSVSIFARDGGAFKVKQVISVVSNPVSVAFSDNHLYILGTTTVESHSIAASQVSPNPDGVVTLLKADGSAAQVGIVQRQLIIAEKINVIETVGLRDDGSVAGAVVLVQSIPGNVDTPFGLVTRGNNAYVTIAHADEISLVRDGAVLTTTPSITQHAPCWLALDGPFLYSSNSPSKSVSRYAVYGQKIVPDAPVVAQFSGSPTDIAAGEGLIAVIDGSGATSHLSIFAVDEDGNLTMLGSPTINAPANGVAIIAVD